MEKSIDFMKEIKKKYLCEFKKQNYLTNFFFDIKTLNFTAEYEKNVILSMRRFRQTFKNHLKKSQFA
jgi:hypothetical protein